MIQYVNIYKIVSLNERQNYKRNVVKLLCEHKLGNNFCIFYKD